jgi:hypothetical protein
MSVRQGVEIDYCPKCCGVWLDRGELDKIIERCERHYEGRRHKEHSPEPSGGDYEKQHRRKSFWSELFD